MEPRASYTLVIDQGTHASRCIVFNGQGDVVASSHEVVALVRHSATEIEQDAMEILASVNRCLQALPGDIVSRVSQAALTGQRSSFLAWHKQSLQPLTAVLSWQDTRSESLLEPFKKYQQTLHSITGLPLSPHYGAGKILYLMQHGIGGSSDDIAGPLMCFLLDHLLAEPRHEVDHSNAHRSLLFDISQRHWSARCLDIFFIPETLLPLCRPVAFDYGRLKSLPVPVKAVCGDQNAAIFSRGLPEAGCAYINVGTGAFVLAMVDRPVTDTALLCSLMTSSETSAIYGLEATVNGAGAALSWLQQQYPRDDLYESLDGWLADIQQVPVFINTIGGLGSPWWKGGEAFFIGDHQQAAACYVAVIESIVFMLFKNLQIMGEYTRLQTIYISGGLSKLNGLCQRLADLSQMKVQRSDDHEATARGAAWLAAGRPQGWHKEVAEVFSPQENNHLSQRYKIFCEAVQRLK